MIVKLDKFEGPFYLLLSLIEEERLSITEVSLVKVADQFIEHIKKTRDIDPEQIADFLVVAAKLLLLKSRALLPYLYPAEDEEIDDFEAQIKMYQEFLAATKTIAGLLGQKHFMFARQFNRKSLLGAERGFIPPKNVNGASLAMVFDDLLSRLKPPDILGEESLAGTISLEDKIDHIRDIIKNKVNFIFSEIFTKAHSRTEMIVGFLAILELMKQREVLIDQTELFGEIQVSRNIT
jgi:segregation and condensation protein A